MKIQLTHSTVNSPKDAKQRRCQKLWGVQGRLSMEVHALLAYGSASRSVLLLWQYNLLDLIFPLLAKYLAERKYPR